MVRAGLFGEEDCLFLNVYTPDLNKDAGRAVMVFFHPGGFNAGSGDDDLFGPDFLIEKDVILVTINFRLGVLGNCTYAASDWQCCNDSGYIIKCVIAKVSWIPVMPVHLETQVSRIKCWHLNGLRTTSSTLVDLQTESPYLVRVRAVRLFSIIWYHRCLVVKRKHL